MNARHLPPVLLDTTPEQAASTVEAAEGRLDVGIALAVIAVLVVTGALIWNDTKWRQRYAAQVEQREIAEASLEAAEKKLEMLGIPADAHCEKVRGGIVACVPTGARL